MANSAAEALARQIERKIERIANEDDFAVLGLPDAAEPEEIDQAHEILVRWFDPDRVEALGLSGMRVLAERIVARLDEAHWQLREICPTRMVLRTRAFAVGTASLIDAA